jgi:hypothetical protein
LRSYNPFVPNSNKPPLIRLKRDDDTRQRHEVWRQEIRSYCFERKLGHAEHLWNEYQHRHNLVWNLVFRLTAAVVVLAIIPYTQIAVMKRIGLWILGPPFLGFVLAIFGFFRVHSELKQLDHIRDLYRPLQDSLFYVFHGDKGSTFGIYVRLYIIFLSLLAALNILLIDNCWMPKDVAIGVFHSSSWFCDPNASIKAFLMRVLQGATMPDGPEHP